MNNLRLMQRVDTGHDDFGEDQTLLPGHERRVAAELLENLLQVMALFDELKGLKVTEVSVVRLENVYESHREGPGRCRLDATFQLLLVGDVAGIPIHRDGWRFVLLEEYLFPAWSYSRVRKRQRSRVQQLGDLIAIDHVTGDNLFRHGRFVLGC